MNQAQATLTGVTLAERLKEAREAAGLNQVELAELAGVVPGTIGNLESGTRKTARKLASIAAALNVSALWLETGDGPREALRPPGPPPPPRNFADRREVSDTDWGLLQDVHLVMTDQELDELRARAQRLRRKVHEQLETVAAGSESRASERRIGGQVAPSPIDRKHKK